MEISEKNEAPMLVKAKGKEKVFLNYNLYFWMGWSMLVKAKGKEKVFLNYNLYF